MPGNTFGDRFAVTSFGESHGPGLGGVIDGCPAGIAFDESLIHHQLARRRPGQSAIVTQRKEADEVEILSGVFEGRTTGAPIGFLLRNKDHRAKDYEHIRKVFRPGHADLTYFLKYGHRDHRGGGRASARETASWVVGGAVARMLLSAFSETPMSFEAWVSSVGDITFDQHPLEVDASQVDDHPVRCPDPDTADRMEELIRRTRKAGDTVGGTVTGRIRNVEPGLGEPVFNKLHADLGKAMLSINAVKGFEYGSGFEGTAMNGSEHNDPITHEEGRFRTRSNNAGGVLGGIATGSDIYFRVAFKPVATIMRDQTSVDRNGEPVTVQGKGRHDPCVVPRAVPIVESMAALVMADHYLRAAK